jgi:hypothetical protein
MTRMAGRLALTVALAMIAAAAAPREASAAVFCKKKKGAVVVRNACKANETQLNLTDFGVLGSNAKATDADRLDGTDSSGFLPIGGKAADANTLDGIDSKGYQVIMRGQRYEGGGGTSLTAAGQTEVNSVSFTAPLAGSLIISGSAFVNNNGLQQFYDLIPLVDGATIGDGTKAVTQAAADTNLGEVVTLAYTASFPVAAGNHIVSQTVGPQAGTSDFFHNRTNLSVLFVPDPLGMTSTLAVALTAGGSVSTVSPNGD